MKRRRISAAFVELNSAEVIQSKDKQTSLSEAGVLTPSQNQNRRSPRIASKTGATPEDKPTLDTELSKDQNINNESRCGAFNTLQKADTSHLADIASNPRDIEHAILNQSQPKPKQIDKIGEVVNETDQRQSIQKSKSTTYSKPQCPVRTSITRFIPATTGPKEIPRQTNSPVSMFSKGGSSSLAQLEFFKGEPKPLIPSTQGHSVSSRLRPSTRKSHVLQTKANVDWSEDLRPTDEDEPVSEGVEGSGPLISSPNSEHANQLKKPSKYRREAPQMKSTRSNAPRVKKLKYENHELPLNTLQLGKESRGPDAGQGLSPVEPNAMDMHEPTDIPENTLHVPEKQQLNEPDMRSSHQTPIETSGLSLDDCDRTMADPHTNDEMPRNESQDLIGGARGRGKAVGKKLTNALRGPKKRLSVSRARHVSPVSVTQESVSRNTRSRHLLRRELGMEQVKVTTRKPYEKKIELTFPQLALDTEIPSRKIEVVEDEVSMAMPNECQKRSESDESTEKEISNDGATRCNEIPGHDLPLPLPSAITVHSLLDASKEDGQHSQSFSPETSVSSQISPGSRFHNHETSFHPANGQTPESQRPLLTAQPCLSPLPGNTSSPTCQWSTKRGCTVDHNGSPRLKPQVNTRTGLIQTQPRMNHLSPVTGTSDSSSIYSSSGDDEESLEVCSLEHQPVTRPRPIWTKFQQDMLREYGIEAEQLVKQRTKSLFFSANVKNDVSVKSVEDRRELETRPTRPQTPIHKATFSKTKTHYVNQGGSPAETQQTSQRISDKSGQYSDQRKYEPAPSAQYAPRADSNSISSSLAQNGSGCMDWISALKTAQQTAHDQLLETNQCLSIQLAAEQESIREVLQIYRQGCNRMLQDIFRAQELRMELYQRQMASVKEQHTEICQDLIRGLQELDCQLQQGPEGRDVPLPHIP